MNHLPLPNQPRPTADLAYDNLFNQLRKIEFSRLDTQKHTYLDYTGSGLYAESQLFQHHALLRDQLLGNPYAGHLSSKFTTQLAEEASTKVLDFFHAKDYICVFTPNISRAFSMIGACYPFDENSIFMPLAAHNSVNSIRAYCHQKGGKTHEAPLQEDLQIASIPFRLQLERFKKASHKLFAYPAQSATSGIKYHLDWIKTAQEKGWDVL